MPVNYKNFRNHLFINNNKTLVNVLTEKENQGKEENQAPYKKINKFFKK